MPTSALVALIRSAPTTVLDDIERLMRLAQFQRRLDPRSMVLLRPDARRHYPFPGANTTPWQLEGVLRALRTAGVDDIAWNAPRSSIVNLGAGEDLNGYLPLLREYGVTSIDSAGAIRHDARLVLLPTLKTDAAATIGGAVQCLVDKPMRLRGITQREAHELLVGALAANRENSAEILAVMDGTTVGVGAGPYGLRPQIRGVLLASADPLALDAVAARLMGFDPLRDAAYLRLAHERGLGVADPQAIELVGDVDLATKRWTMANSRSRRLRVPQLRPGIVGRVLECARWPTVERPVFESWLRGTQWGRLFAHYQRLGYGERRISGLALETSDLPSRHEQ